MEFPKKHLAAVAFALAGTANAGVVFTSSAYGLMGSDPIVSWCSTCGDKGDYTVLNPFSLSSVTVLSAVDVGVTAAYGKDWNVEVSIWSADRSQVLQTAHFANGSYTARHAGSVVDDLRFQLPSWNLGAGDYWISFKDDAKLSVAAYVTDAPDYQYQVYPGGEYYLGTEGAYRIEGVSAVPESGTLALTLAGLGVLGLLTRRRGVASGVPAGTR